MQLFFAKIGKPNGLVIHFGWYTKDFFANGVSNATCAMLHTKHFYHKVEKCPIAAIIPKLNPHDLLETCNDSDHLPCWYPFMQKIENLIYFTIQTYWICTI